MSFLSIKILLVAEAIRKKIDLKRIYNLSKIDPWFLEQIKEIVEKLEKVKTVPYKHNYGYFFTSGPNTWHGMEKKEIKKERRCLQVNYVTFETDWKVD